MHSSISTHSRLFRHVAATTVAAAVMLSALGASGAEAATTPFWTTGQAGISIAPDRGTCRYLGAWHAFNLSTNPPDVYARDNTWGGGNDSQWVRYRTYEVRASTGATLRWNAWSEWKIASDITHASFDSGQYFPDVEAKTVLEVRVEWWNQTQMLGAAAHRISSYTYYRDNAGPFGPISSCA